MFTRPTLGYAFQLIDFDEPGYATQRTKIYVYSYDSIYV